MTTEFRKRWQEKYPHLSIEDLKRNPLADPKPQPKKETPTEKRVTATEVRERQREFEIRNAQSLLNFEHDLLKNIDYGQMPGVVRMQRGHQYYRVPKIGKPVLTEEAAYLDSPCLEEEVIELKPYHIAHQVDDRVWHDINDSYRKMVALAMAKSIERSIKDVFANYETVVVTEPRIQTMYRPDRMATELVAGFEMGHSTV